MKNKAFQFLIIFLIHEQPVQANMQTTSGHAKYAATRTVELQKAYRNP